MDFRGFKDKYEKREVKQTNYVYPDEIMVSISVVTYQHANYLKDCLDGILMQQTDFPFEVLLGEDDSTDGTREICMEYAKKYPDKIRLFLHHRENNIKINGQPTGRFNFMYNMFSARGKYIALCEGDDYWTDPLKLQKQVDFLEANEDFILTFHDFKVLNQYNRIQEDNLKLTFKRDLTQHELMDSPFLLMFTICFRNILKDFPLEFFQIVNGDRFLISILGENGNGKYINTISPSAYRLHPGGLWTSASDLQKELNELKTFYYLSKYHKRQRNSETAGELLKRFKSKSYYLLREKFELRTENKIAQHFFSMNLYKLSLYFFLYKFSTGIIDKGYIFRRKWIRTIESL